MVSFSSSIGLFLCRFTFFFLVKRGKLQVEEGSVIVIVVMVSFCRIVGYKGENNGGALVRVAVFGKEGDGEPNKRKR